MSDRHCSAGRAVDCGHERRAKKLIKESRENSETLAKAEACRVSLVLRSEPAAKSDECPVNVVNHVAQVLLTS